MVDEFFMLKKFIYLYELSILSIYNYLQMVIWFYQSYY